MTRNQIEYAKLLETKRANLANESLKQSIESGNLALRSAELQETQRRNKASENIESGKADEVARHNLATEQHALSQLGLETRKLTEMERSNIAKELETKRSNLASESIASTRNAISQQEANIHSDLAASTIKKDEAFINESIQKVLKLESDISMQEQENVRRWISSISTTAKDIASVANTLIDMFGGNMSQALKNALGKLAGNKSSFGSPSEITHSGFKRGSGFTGVRGSGFKKSK